MKKRASFLSLLCILLFTSVALAGNGNGKGNPNNSQGSSNGVGHQEGHSNGQGHENHNGNGFGHGDHSNDSDQGGNQGNGNQGNGNNGNGVGNTGPGNQGNDSDNGNAGGNNGNQDNGNNGNQGNGNNGNGVGNTGSGNQGNDSDNGNAGGGNDDGGNDDGGNDDGGNDDGGNDDSNEDDNEDEEDKEDEKEDDNETTEQAPKKNDDLDVSMVISTVVEHEDEDSLSQLRLDQYVGGDSFTELRGSHQYKFNENVACGGEAGTIRGGLYTAGICSLRADVNDVLSFKGEAGLGLGHSDGETGLAHLWRAEAEARIPNSRFSGYGSYGETTVVDNKAKTFEAGGRYTHDQWSVDAYATQIERDGRDSKPIFGLRVKYSFGKRK